ncbi:MAG: branched-chain amino acid ABC transporter substrate-binding protein [Anaerolineales bacterium]|jgi:branched-chain amino acid transport system substrate-binding protein
MKARYVLTALFILSMVLAACAPAATAPAACKTDAFGCAVFKPGAPIVIGVGAPMTGGNASFGIDISNAQKIAATDAATFDGHPFQIDAEDDGGTAEGGAAVANKFVSEPSVVAVAGHVFSGATQAAIPIYEKAGIPMMSPSATNPALTQSGSKVFNRLVFTDAEQGKFAAQYLYNKLNVKQLAVMDDGATYGAGLAGVVKDTFTSLGGTVVSYTTITPGLADYSAPLAAVASKKPQALFYGGYVAEGVIIANQMAQSGLKGVILFSDDGVYGADFISRAGPNAEGAYATGLIPPPSPAKTKFDAEYLAAYGQPAGKLSPYSWTGYDSAAVLIHVIEQVGIQGSDGNLYIPRGALVTAVRSISGYQGIAGVVTCDPTGECSASGPTFYQVKNGQWVIAGS